MGFSVDNTRPLEIRNNNYYESKENQLKQDQVIIITLGLLKQAGATAIYNYLNLTNDNQERFPKTSIRRALNTLLRDNKIVCIGVIKGQYDKNESLYKIKEIFSKIDQNQESFL